MLSAWSGQGKGGNALRSAAPGKRGGNVLKQGEENPTKQKGKVWGNEREILKSCSEISWRVTGKFPARRGRNALESSRGRNSSQAKGQISWESAGIL